MFGGIGLYVCDVLYQEEMLQSSDGVNESNEEELNMAQQLLESLRDSLSQNGGTCPFPLLRDNGGWCSTVGNTTTQGATSTCGRLGWESRSG